MTNHHARLSTTGRPWARYLRLSKAEAAEVRGLTRTERIELTNRKLDDHLERITEWMESRGLPFDDRYIYRDPGLSAWKPSVRRPGWDAMMAAARAGEISGIAVVAIDRYTRQVTVGEQLIKLASEVDIQIGGGRAGILDLTTYAGITTLRGMVMQAENESLATSYRLRETLETQKRKGKPLGGGRSFGFEVVGNKRIIEVPQVAEEVDLLREVGAKMVAGATLSSLAEYMNAKGFRTVKGSPWNAKNLGRMLIQDRYGGRVKVKDAVMDGEVEVEPEVWATMPGTPVFDAETHAAIKAIMASRARGRRPTNEYLLTGIIMCADCRLTLAGWRSWARRNGVRPRRYKCVPNKGGCHRAISAEEVEHLVAMKVVGIMADRANADRIEADRATLVKSRASTYAELTAVEGRLTELEVKWATGKTIGPAYDQAKAALDSQRIKIMAKIDKLPDDEPSRLDLTAEDGSTPEGLARLRQARADWDAMDIDQRRYLIREYRLRPAILGDLGHNRFDHHRLVYL